MQRRSRRGISGMSKSSTGSASRRNPSRGSPFRRGRPPVVNYSVNQQVLTTSSSKLQCQALPSLPTAVLNSPLTATRDPSSPTAVKAKSPAISPASLSQANVTVSYASPELLNEAATASPPIISNTPLLLLLS